MPRGGAVSECVARLATGFLKNDSEGAKACEGGLKEVEANEGGEPKPVYIDIVGQPEREQDSDAGEGENDALDGHDGSPPILESRRTAGARILRVLIFFSRPGAGRGRL
jgi:hypothetical protein